jgi:hypothetical protein
MQALSKFFGHPIVTVMILVGSVLYKEYKKLEQEDNIYR